MTEAEERTPPRVLPTKRSWRWASASIGLVASLASASIGCDRSPPEPSPPPMTGGLAEPSTPAPDEAACVITMSDVPPPVATSVTDCPDDPEGRPIMPLGSVRFPEASRAPELVVERALTEEHRMHGLMYRPELADTEGMIFTWPTASPRSFWMKNTCLALDMLFIDDRGFVAGILEQVPPMNEAPRRIPCRAQHVLEVRAGFARDYGVAPGQRVDISEELPENQPAP